MKYFYVGLMILCILLSVCWLSSREIRERTSLLTEPLEQALRVTETDGRLRLAKQALAIWEEQERVLASLLNHSAIREIDGSIRELSMMEGPEFRRLCLRLIRQINALYELELPRLKNVF